MPKSEPNLIKVADSASPSYLEKRLIELEEENKVLKERLELFASSSSMTQEREVISFYLEIVANRIAGIPSISKILKEVILDLSGKIKNGEHFRVNSDFRGGR